MKAPNNLEDEKVYQNRPYDEVHEELSGKGIRHRRTRIDGSPRLGTGDINWERINFEVENGIITRAYRG